jgi:hypothetical protein
MFQNVLKCLKIVFEMSKMSFKTVEKCQKWLYIALKIISLKNVKKCLKHFRGKMLFQMLNDVDPKQVLVKKISCIVCCNKNWSECHFIVNKNNGVFLFWTDN